MNATFGFPIFDRLPPPTDVRAHIVADLLASDAAIAPRFFYDPLGCVLYEAITRLDEYYPTRTEKLIFEQSVATLQSLIPANSQYIDLGSGDSEKAALLLPVLKPTSYLAVDIARTAIEAALPKLAKIAPQVALGGVVTDFAEKFDFTSALEERPRLFVYPGSSIGNFTPALATAFLSRLRALCASSEDRIIIGVDSVKAKARLDAAYDDALGVTAAFNRNVLLHINRVVGSNFRLSEWVHRGFFNTAQSRIEMHLEAVNDVEITFAGQSRKFQKGERIHTENSYKYTRAGFTELLAAAGFSVIGYCTEAQQDFHVFIAQPKR